MPCSSLMIQKSLGDISLHFICLKDSLVYREERIQVFLQSKFLILCLGTFSFIVLRYTGWRTGTNLRSTEDGYYQLQCIPIHLCFLSLLPKYQTPSYGILISWYCKSSLASRKHWNLSNLHLALEYFHGYQLLWHVLQDYFLVRRICKYMVSPYKYTSYQNIWSPKETTAIISSLEEDPFDFRNKHGNSFSNPASWRCNCTERASLCSLKHKAADSSQGNRLDSW